MDSVVTAGALQRGLEHVHCFCFPLVTNQHDHLRGLLIREVKLMEFIVRSMVFVHEQVVRPRMKVNPE